MVEKLARRRQGSRMQRINSRMGIYGKSLGATMLFGAALACICLYLDNYFLGRGSDSSSGRSLLSTGKVCEGDSVLPLFPYEHTWDVGFRACLYCFALGFLFLGVAISADVFMSAIEVITSKTKKVTLRGEEVEIEVWNATVANLTLMALGSSAPEILLAVVETCSLGFKAGDLGPGTIVGSAAFNLLFITAICISCLPETEEGSGILETRRIDEFGVFGITAVASLFAYGWMVIVLGFITPDEVHILEALATLLFFPLLVWVSWAQDNAWWGMCGAEQVDPGLEELMEEAHHKVDIKSVTGEDGKVRRGSTAPAVASAPEAFKESKEVKADPEAAAKKAAEENMKKKKKSRLEYRIQATRKMTGGKRVLPTANKKLGEGAEDGAMVGAPPPPLVPQIVLSIDKPMYRVMESTGICEVVVKRSGMMELPCIVQYDTSDGTAVCGEDYIHTAGVLDFKPGVTEATIEVEVIDDNEWEPDEHFFVRLFNPQATGADSKEKVHLDVATTQVWILNDDDPGKVSFAGKTMHALDTDDSVDIPLIRSDGYDGNVLAFLKTVEGTAKEGLDFVPLAADSEVHFPDKVSDASVKVQLLKNAMRENATFTVMVTAVEPAGASIGENMCTVIITNDKEYQKLMEEVVAMMDAEMGKYQVGSSSWAQQFNEAMNMGGDDDEGTPELADYVLHFLSFYWKVLHAVIPPTDYWGGWATFYVSLIFIGVITMFVGDVAKMFGCCVGLADGINAITFVALGTSLPDTFASVEATCSDDNADAAITNVTGSNSVNVFLGLGLPWTMAAIYWTAEDGVYHYPAGDLVFSVLVFFVFALCCLGLLLVRRWTPSIGGELGGPKGIAYGSSAFLTGSWLVYVIISALKTEGHI